jgi:hypothetical protein
MIQKILLSGWIKPLVLTETYTQGVFDRNYNMIDEHEEEAHPLAMGLYNDSYPEGTPLAELIADAFHKVEWHCKKNEVNASVMYHIANVEKNWDELTTNMLNTLEGEADAAWGHHFSSLTGYLWTDQEFIVNRHDVIEEIGKQIAGKYWKFTHNYKPKYLLIEVTFSGE